MSKIISIGTAVPEYKHRQEDILPFMQRIYALDSQSNRKLKYLYQQSGIEWRYSVIPDYTRPTKEWKFYPPTENLEPFPTLERRLALYRKCAAPLSIGAIRRCLDRKLKSASVTHLITVSCTGVSAPGLDLELVEALGMPATAFRTSVNFMGCYAAVHALKLADVLISADPGAKVLVVCTELCTLHFQQEATVDNMLSSLLFADGAAAVLLTSDDDPAPGLRLKGFYSEIVPKGKGEMTWDLSSTGFRMTLSHYVADLIEADFSGLVHHALEKSGVRRNEISDWCIHPGGKKILDTISKSLSLPQGCLDDSYETLKLFGNMSSPTILYVLQRMMARLKYERPNRIFAAAFGPGLTMETFIAETN
ncbi:MAG TPA: type III polyketide synthase [Puia sp.]|nr:type III polyketide synthase [Puia sp.]